MLVLWTALPYLYMLPVSARVVCTRAFPFVFVDHSATFCLPAQQSPNLKIIPSPTSPFSSRHVPPRFPISPSLLPHTFHQTPRQHHPFTNGAPLIIWKR
jgi:hypothetical protein